MNKIMTVAELKAKLEEFPDDSIVLMQVDDEAHSIDVVREALWEILLECRHE